MWSLAEKRVARGRRLGRFATAVNLKRGPCLQPRRRCEFSPRRIFDRRNSPTISTPASLRFSSSDFIDAQNSPLGFCASKTVCRMAAERAVRDCAPGELLRALWLSRTLFRLTKFFYFLVRRYSVDFASGWGHYSLCVRRYSEPIQNRWLASGSCGRASKLLLATPSVRPRAARRQARSADGQRPRAEGLRSRDGQGSLAQGGDDFSNDFWPSMKKCS